MPKTQGKPGGRVSRIVSEVEEKRIIDFLQKRKTLEDYQFSFTEKKRFLRLASRFTVAIKPEGEWPNGEVLLYTTKSVGTVPLHTRIYAGQYRVDTLCKFFHDTKGHMGQNRTYQYEL